MEWFFHTIPHATRLLPQERIAETQRSLKDFVSQHGGDKDLLLLAEKPSSRPLLYALIQDDEALFRLVDQVFQTNEAWIFQKGVQLLFTALRFVFLSFFPFLLEHQTHTTTKNMQLQDQVRLL